jgi:beta-lactamase superfamily II metal-dependent hydrolase
MKITVFQSDKGDCLLLEGSKGTTVLVDGGMEVSYSEHVAPALGAMREHDRALDLVYVSHIDSDHIGGILRLMDDEVAWRVFEYQKKVKNPKAKKFEPENARPPRVKELWHNVFGDVVGDNRGALEDVLLAAMKTTLLDQELRSSFEQLDNLMNSERQALLLKHRVSPEQLDIDVNRPTSKKLMFIGEGGTVRKPIKRKELQLTVVGPRRKELDDLRKEWNRWVEKNREAVARIRARAQADAERIHADEALSFQTVLMSLAEELGDRSAVTPPNLASLMLVVSDSGKRILLTGDSHPDDIEAGLKHAKLLDKNGRCHFDVIKVQHHGSENNLGERLFENVTADHYVFCGNGSHGNPDTRFVELLIRKRKAAPGATNGFKLWFNSSEKFAPAGPARNQMVKVEKLVKKEAASSQGKVEFFFLKNGSSFELPL